MLDIIIHPDDRLRQTSRNLTEEELKSSTLAKFINQMIDTMEAEDGIGLAAAQVGETIRLIVVSTKDGPLAMINPAITKRSWRQEWGEEGCLSLPRTFGEVKRRRGIRCGFIDRQGKRRRLAATGLLARVIQHEIDHLNGVLFIDLARNIHQEGPTL